MGRNVDLGPGDRKLDPERLVELEKLLGTGRDHLVGMLVRELTRAMDELGAALAREDLEAAGLAAHSARNSALMIDAAPLLEPLAVFEAHARRGDAAAARDVEPAVRREWAALRGQLTRLAGSES